MQQAYL